MISLRLPLAVALLSFAGCGGSGSRTAGAGTAPTIRTLTFEPRVVYAGAIPTTFAIGMELLGPERDATELQLTVRDPVGAVVLDQRYPLGTTGQGSDTLGATVSAALSRLGSFDVAVQVLTAGGRRSNVLSTTVDVVAYPWLDSLPDPVVRRHAAAAAFDGSIFVLGGERRDLGLDPGPATAIVARFDPVRDTWSLGAPLAVARRALTAASNAGVLAAIGGYDATGNPVGTNELLAAGASGWSQGAPMPTARAHAAAAAVGGRIYVVGGADAGSDALGTVESYDPLTDSWRTEPPLPHPRAECRAAAFAGRLVVAGGRRNATDDEPWLDVFDPATGSWTFPRSLGDCAYLVAIGDELFGGFASELFGTQPGALTNWRLLTPSLQPARRGVAAAAMAETLYVFGETTAWRYVRTLEIR
ncbi:MAG: hypothetical protein MUC36_11205 [Planctomycetes bacterium]|jgi:hypothetical protein|nr:hypothetical protein [Planctomycetota bacterium]